MCYTPIWQPTLHLVLHVLGLLIEDCSVARNHNMLHSCKTRDRQMHSDLCVWLQFDQAATAHNHQVDSERKKPQRAPIACWHGCSFGQVKRKANDMFTRTLTTAFVFNWACCWASHHNYRLPPTDLLFSDGCHIDCTNIKDILANTKYIAY